MALSARVSEEIFGGDVKVHRQREPVFDPGLGLTGFPSHHVRTINSNKFSQAIHGHALFKPVEADGFSPHFKRILRHKFAFQKFLPGEKPEAMRIVHQRRISYNPKVPLHSVI
jgi:hypothetical protein